MFCQGDNNRIEIVEFLISRIIVPLFLLHTKDQPSVLDKGDCSIMSQFDTADSHTVSEPNVRYTRFERSPPTAVMLRDSDGLPSFTMHALGQFQSEESPAIV
ncbi:hypothetical protein XI01_05550 [Bradyrhizobium sp. CCBAU 21360]|nr:hypothetical protein [Bradyrhizobium sp. CCBAU 21360]